MHLLTSGVILLVLALFLPRIVRSKETRTWPIFIVRKIMPLVCLGTGLGLLITWLVTVVVER